MACVEFSMCPCPYGVKCYRTSWKHLGQYAHYPMCWYWDECWQHSSEHASKYRHPKNHVPKPKPARMAAAQFKASGPYPKPGPCEGGTTCFGASFCANPKHQYPSE